jgi:hypothetical protein
MRQIIKDTSNELILAVRSPFEAVLGCATVFTLIFLLYTWLHQPSRTDRMIGLAGAAAICAIVFLFAYEKNDFHFDRQTRLLAWSRQQGFFKHKGVVPIGSIERVVLQSCIGNNRYYPKRRVVLVTRDCELPLTISYQNDRMNEVMAERIRAFLDISSKSLLDDSIESLVATGRDLDAIRLLREKNGLSLSDARDIVDRIKDGTNA